MKNDDVSDEQFDAFLKGEDGLSRRLQALPQPTSSAELDAAIFKRIELALAQENRPEAANDAGDASDTAPVPRLQPSFARRWRVPVGIAATLLAGVFANQVFDASGELKSKAEVTSAIDMAAPEVAPAPPAEAMSP